jgi:CBS domain-containing membrane protein
MQDDRVRHIMTAPVLSIGVHEPITEVLRILANCPLHHLPVVDGSQLKGMLSAADMLQLEYFLPKSGMSGSAVLLNDRFRVQKMMRWPVPSAKLDDTIADAASRMATNGIYSLPVIDENNHLLGIVTTTDIMQALLHGIGLEPRPAQHEARRRPTGLQMHRAIRSAESVTLNGTDPDGVAAAMLYLNERNALLEVLRQNVARYLHGGQDERLHTRLVRELDALSQPGEVSELSIPL